jgi:hypothetical protein
MPIVNLTNLTVRLYDDDGEVYATFEPSGDTVSLKSTGETTTVDEAEVDATYVTEVMGLPEPEGGTFYIVPQPVAQVLNRPDLVVPDTGPSAMRNDDGTTYAVKRLYSISMTKESELA